jgi:hypothetical protein
MAGWLNGNQGSRLVFFALRRRCRPTKQRSAATIERTRKHFGIMREYPAATCESAATLKESREALISPSERTARCGYFIFA